MSTTSQNRNPAGDQRRSTDIRGHQQRRRRARRWTFAAATVAGLLTGGVSTVAVASPAPAAHPAACTPGYWTGYWTWARTATGGQWTWTWVWHRGSCGWVVS